MDPEESLLVEVHTTSYWSTVFVSGLRGGAGAHSAGEPLAMMIVGAQ